MTYDEAARPAASGVLSGARDAPERALRDTPERALRDTPERALRDAPERALRDAPERAMGRGSRTTGALVTQRMDTRNAAVAATAPHDPGGAVAEAALQGLLAPRKTLPPALFYDEEGCRLFYEITKLPEYYLTRTEFHLLETIAPEAAALVPAGATLVEYGASDETKAEMLLSQTDIGGTGRFRAYVPIDVAGPALRAMRQRLAVTRPGLSVIPVIADFMRPIVLPERDRETAIMGFFPGSTIGNLQPNAAVDFLRRARTTLGLGARFLLGFDTCRDPTRLIPAYDDPRGVTAQFNRNLLIRLNREAGATFDPDGFAHRAVWNEAESRVEMHLVSRAARTVTVAGHPIHFALGETIHTENSYKYAPERMRALIAEAGWSVAKTWSDSRRLFSIWLLD
jgi:dimethylhistidine N-methyltransferase